MERFVSFLRVGRPDHATPTRGVFTVPRVVRHAAPFAVSSLSYGIQAWNY